MEYDELIKYAESMEQEVIRINKYNIVKRYEIDKHNIEVLFADTDVIQELIDPEKIPNTYPKEYNHLYHRSIKKVMFKECYNQTKPFFTKSFKHKLFDGCMFNDGSDPHLDSLGVKKDTYVYMSTVVKFKNEYRLFIENKKIRGICDASDFILVKTLETPIEPPNEFIEQILDATMFKYIIVDVGLLDNGKWCVVEANPAFSADSYGFDIADYYDYFRNAWKWIIE